MMSCRNSLSMTRMVLARSAARHPLFQRQFASRPVRGTNISPTERAALRAARKERAIKVIEQQKSGSADAGSTVATAEAGGAVSSSTASSSSSRTNLAMSRYIWYLSVGVPSVLLVWGFSDENSPPAKLSRAVGLTNFVRSYTDEIARPAHNKLLPDWSQVRPSVF